jgi:endonuclease/exonuclease/phosphatase family metal-dependent hydrolase
MVRAALFLFALVCAARWTFAGELKFVAYNVQNYLNVLPANGERPGKSDESIAALIDVISALQPDVLGMCEVGKAADWDHLRGKLKAAGLQFEHFEYVEAADPERHVALASRYPIVSRQSAADVSYILDNVPQKVRRGFLDVTIEPEPGYRLRLVGVHLKSKLDAPGGEALLRRNEAHLLRKYIVGILRETPEVNLLVYGDFNSTKDEPALLEIVGERGGAESLRDLAPADAVGDRWTHYWTTADVYSRIDYLFASRGLWPEIAKGKSTVHRSANGHAASDHRPLVAVIHTTEGK